MKIKLKHGFRADNGEQAEDVRTLADLVTVEPILAGYHFPEGSDLRIAEQVRVWAQLSQSEFKRLSYEDYTDILGRWIALWSKGEDEKKAPTDSSPEKESSSKSKQ